MAYPQKTGEILIGSFGVNPDDFDLLTTSSTTVDVVAWRSGISQPSDVAVNAVAGAYTSTPNPFTDAMQAQQYATVGRVSMVRKTGPQTVNQQALVNVTDLGFILLPNKHYVFRFKGFYSAAAATTGLRIGLNGPATPTLLRIEQAVYESATALRMLASVTYDNPVLGVNSGGATVLTWMVEGNISTNAAGGTLIPRMGSEVAASDVTILAGSWGELKAVGQ